MLPLTDLSALRQLRAEPLTAAPAPPSYRYPTAIRRPPWRWRLAQWLLLLRNGSLFVPALAWLGRRLGLVVAYTELRAVVTHADGTATDYGLLSRRVVTTAGVNYLAACFDGTSSVTLFKYMGFGSGSTAAAIGDTTLTTEYTTQYAVANTRPTGSQSHSTNTYVTVATFSPGSGGTLAVTEAGIFSQAATGGGTLFDHLVFAAVNLTAGTDSLAGTFTLTLPAGS